MYSGKNTVEYLIERVGQFERVGGVQRQTCLHLSSSRTDAQATEIVKLIMKKSNQSSMVLMEDGLGNIPLFCAIETGNIVLVKELLKIEVKRQVMEC